MKKIVCAIVAIMLVVPAFSQDIFKQLTSEYADQDGFSATQITEDMFDLYLRKKNIDKESPVYETLKKLENITVVSLSTYGSDEEVSTEGLHSEMLDHYNEDGYTLFKTEKQMGEDVKVFLKKAGESINSLALVTASESSVNLIEMNGDVDLAGLGELSKVMNIRGLENLYKINGSSSGSFFGVRDISPKIYLNDFNEDGFFSASEFLRLQSQMKDQSSMSAEQIEKYHQQAEEMSRKQAEMAEKYRQMFDQYGRRPIFLTTPGDTNVVYIINGKEATIEEVKELGKEGIETINVSEDEENSRDVIRITTKKK